MVQWLGLCTLTAKGMGSIPGLGTRFLQAVWHGQKFIYIKRERVSHCQTFFWALGIHQ